MLKNILKEFTNYNVGENLNIKEIFTILGKCNFSRRDTKHVGIRIWMGNQGQFHELNHEEL